jgi:DNA-binding MarR family transcriptional regulator/GNAT superfamily N-acetyltransferase
MSTLQHHAARIRQFNRFWTSRIGLVDRSYLGSDFTLTEIRALYELDQQSPLELSALRNELQLDAGYLTRILKRFKRDGLVASKQAADDRRRQLLELTTKGQAELDELSRRANSGIAALLQPLDASVQAEVVASMSVIEDAFKPVDEREPYLIRGLQPGDLGWLVQRHGQIYNEEFGWGPRFEALVAGIASNYVENLDAEREHLWIAERHGRPVGCIMCASKDADSAQLRVLFVEPSTRGLGIGYRLVEECVRFAKRSGYARMDLWTTDEQVSACRLYSAVGFSLVSEETDSPFGVKINSQLWSVDLTTSSGTSS